MNQRSVDRTARDAAYFDQWYAEMTTSPVKDAILMRNLGLPPELGSAGILHMDAMAEIADGLRCAEGDLLADIACGRGGYGIEVALRCNADLVGVDFSAVALEWAEDLAARRLPPGRAEFRVGDLTATGLSSGTVDAVMCTDSVQFVDPAVALREFRRVLRPGGRLALTTWEPAVPGDARIRGHLHDLDLRTQLLAAGFSDVTVEDRPQWRAAERDVWLEAAATPNEHSDAALASMQEEGRRSLESFDALRRVISFAVAP